MGIFPHTSEVMGYFPISIGIQSTASGHVKMSCLLPKLSEAKSYIGVKAEIDKLDLTAAESKASCDDENAMRYFQRIE